MVLLFGRGRSALVLSTLGGRIETHPGGIAWESPVMRTNVKPKVLVIDDEQIVADTLATILKLHGFNSKSFHSGEAALECVEGFHPDVVLSDIRMHKLDGIETAKRIRELHPECRIILFTATRVDDSTRHQIIEELGFEFLERPLHPAEVLTRLRA